MAERCPDCGFDAAEWRPRDAASLLRALPEWGHRAPDDDADLLDLAHQACHRMFEAARGLPPITSVGRVAQVNTSNGGVPKTPVDHAEIDFAGVVGDRQFDRKHHGRPFQALCLWSAEVIGELQGQGHPIGPGSAGENITISGLDWAAVRPGTLLRIGAALAEVSFDATPCKKQSQWFSDGDFTRISIEENPQWVRWYAWVREPGAVKPGDVVGPADVSPG